MNRLYILPLPPPVHGSSMMSMYIINSKQINKNVNYNYVNLSTSRKMEEIQKFSIKKIFRFLYSYIKTFTYLISTKYDTCYLAISCFGIPFLKDAPFVIMCKFFCKNVIIHFHNKGMKKYSSVSFYKWVYKLVLKNTTIILLSDLLYDDVKEIVKKEQVKICPNGIPDNRDYKVTKNINSTPNILFLSNLIKSKGVLCLLDACKILKDRNCKFTCNLVGGATKEISIENIEEEINNRNLGNQVFYKGRAYGTEKETYYNEADIFVFPTYYTQECFPVVLLEAMQHKLACISSYEGAIPEIISDGYNGLLCNPHDSVSLANCLEKLIYDKESRLKMGENGFNLYKKKYRLTHFENNLNLILRRN